MGAAAVSYARRSWRDDRAVPEWFAPRLTTTVEPQIWEPLASEDRHVTLLRVGLGSTLEWCDRSEDGRARLAGCHQPLSE